MQPGPTRATRGAPAPGPRSVALTAAVASDDAGSATLVEAVDLVRDFGPVRAVDGVDIRLARGDVLGLLGPNGAGKTSTLRMLCGTLAPTRGRIAIAGIDLLAAPRRAKQGIGYLPEQPPVYPDMTVAEYLEFSARLHGLRGGARRAAIASAESRCALEPLRRRLIGRLSKGYRQRVGIAQAILHAPPVIILDEPTVGLDPIQIRDIRALIAELGREHAVILSTHILPEIQAVCSHVQIMHQGRIAWRDTLDDADASVDCHHVRVTLAPGSGDPAMVAGVRRCEALGERRYRIELEHGPAVLETLTADLVAAGFGVREFVPERRSLEQIFVEVTAGDTAESTPA